MRRAKGSNYKEAHQEFLQKGKGEVRKKNGISCSWAFVLFSEEGHGGERRE